jgi:uncharacterized secreted protein with C-terminal beta-propeller domain
MARRFSSRTALAVVSTAALLLAGCTTDRSGAFTRQRMPRLSLVAYDSCDRLLTELRAAARQNVTPYGLDGAGPVPEAMAGGARSAYSAPSAERSPGGTDHSGTNVHEANADEPDLVKTDGRRIVTLAGGALRVIDPATRVQTGRLDLGEDGARADRLLLAGDRALILVDDIGQQVLGRRMYSRGYRPAVLLVDLSGPPRLISRYHGTGRLLDARQTGGVARIVLSTTPAIDFRSEATSTERLLADNRAAVGKAPIDAWLPTWEVTTGATTATGRVDCSAISRPASFSGTSILTVLTFDLGAPTLGDGSPVGVVADGDIVYGTGADLYVANNRRGPLNGVVTDTEIFRFVLPPDAGRPVYAASGTVPGTLLNQYALSAWNGTLRVATTDPRTDASAVRVLRERDGELAQVGVVDGLGHGERIYSVRFVGPRGYVVTFKQTDPLYSLDLGDPTRPRVTGELKITGYSAHLQPVGDDRLVGIGQEATTRGSRTAVQVSLFDVANPADPRRLARHQVPDASSEAEYDPHALLWWPATGLLVVPVADNRGTSALALHVTADGLRTVGRVTQPADAWAPIRRSLVVGDTLWSVTDTGLVASSLSTMDRVGWVPFGA